MGRALAFAGASYFSRMPGSLLQVFATNSAHAPTRGESEKMRPILLIACLSLCTDSFATAQVSITQSQTGWQLSNGHIQLELTRSGHGVRMKPLRRQEGAEWAAADTPLVAFPEKGGKGVPLFCP